MEQVEQDFFGTLASATSLTLKAASNSLHTCSLRTLYVMILLAMVPVLLSAGKRFEQGLLLQTLLPCTEA